MSSQEKIIKWYGEFDDSNISNLKKLCEFLGCRYFETTENHKNYFMFKLNEEMSYKLISVVRKFGLTVNTDCPPDLLPGKIKNIL